MTFFVGSGLDIQFNYLIENKLNGDIYRYKIPIKLDIWGTYWIRCFVDYPQ